MNPEIQHLYLMQNQYGCVKIGRSIDPERRRRSVQIEDRCVVRIVAIKERWGSFEEEIHLELEKLGLRIDGEWFQGLPDALPAYLAALDLDANTKWPFSYDESAAASWTEKLAILRDARAYSGMIRRFIDHLRATEEGDENWDLALWQNFGPGDELRYKYRPEGWWIVSGPLADQRLPQYTRDVQAALSLWPDDVRPTPFDGSAIECCIEALKRHR